MEINGLKTSPDFISISETNGNYELKYFMNGPPETDFEGGRYRLKICFQKGQYPFKPPQMFFESNIYHPNVGVNGDICVDFLKGEWTPVYTIKKAVEALQVLLMDPNPSSPLNSEAAKNFNNNRNEFRKINQEFIKNNA